MSWRDTVFPEGFFASFSDLCGLIEPLRERSLAVSSWGWNFEPEFFQMYGGGVMPLKAFDYYWWRNFTDRFSSQLRYVIPRFINHTVPDAGGPDPVFWSYESIFEHLREAPIELPEAGAFRLPWAIEWGCQMYRVLNLLRWTSGGWSREHRTASVIPSETVRDIRTGYAACLEQLPSLSWRGTDGMLPEREVTSCLSDFGSGATVYHLRQGRVRAVIPDYLGRVAAPAPESVEIHFRVKTLDHTSQHYFNALPSGEATEGDMLMYHPVCTGKGTEGFEFEPLTLRTVPPEAVDAWLADPGVAKSTVWLPDFGGIFCTLEFRYVIVKHELVPDFNYFDP